MSWKVPPQQTLTSAIYLCLAGSQETTMHFGIQIMFLQQQNKFRYSCIMGLATSTLCPQCVHNNFPDLPSRKTREPS